MTDEGTIDGNLVEVNYRNTQYIGYLSGPYQGGIYRLEVTLPEKGISSLDICKRDDKFYALSPVDVRPIIGDLK